MGEHARDPNYVPRFKKRYNEVIRPELMKKFGYTNMLQVPQHRTRSCSISAPAKAAADAKKIQAGAERSDRDRRPEGGRSRAPRRRSRPSRSRAGLPIGVKVTLRKDRMYEFLDRLITMALPRVRDFRGVNRQELRRPRQLRHGPEGAHRLRRDRLRQDRNGVGHGHHRSTPLRRPTRKPRRFSKASSSRS